MKRKAILAAALSLIAVLFSLTGCTAKYRISEPEFLDALINAFAHDAMTINVTLKQDYYEYGTLYSYRATSEIVIENGTKYKFTTTSVGSKTVSYYYYFEGNSWYIVQKNDNNAWISSKDSTFQGFDEILEDMGFNNELLNEDEYTFDDLLFRRGRYYYSDEMLLSLNTSAVTYDSAYLGFTKKKLTSLGMKLSDKDGNNMSISIGIAHKGSVILPKYTAA